MQVEENCRFLYSRRYFMPEVREEKLISFYIRHVEVISNDYRYLWD